MNQVMNIACGVSLCCSGAVVAQVGALWMTPSYPAIGSSVTRVGPGVQAGWLRIEYPGLYSQQVPAIWNGSAASAQSLLPVSIGSTAGKVLGLDGHRQVGWVNLPQGDTTAAYWEGTVESFRALALTDPIYTGGKASGISGNQVVGEAYYNVGRGGRHACLWDLSTGSWQDLQPTGGLFSNAFDTDGEYQCGRVLYSATGQYSAVLWRGTAASAVNLEPPGSRISECFAVANGTQVGYAQTSDFVMRPVVWHGTAASWRDLLPTGCIRGQILDTTGDIHVGWVTKNGVGDTAVLWFGDNRNTILELRTLLGPQWGPCVATSISVEGDIATIGGYGRIAGSVVEQGILWTVRVPTPGGMGVLVMGGLAAMRRRRGAP